MAVDVLLDIRLRNKFETHTGHDDRRLNNFAGHNRIFTGHLLLFLFAPIVRMTGEFRNNNILYYELYLYSNVF